MAALLVQKPGRKTDLDEQRRLAKHEVRQTEPAD
jgi:hypothetical protein